MVSSKQLHHFRSSAIKSKKDFLRSSGKKKSSVNKNSLMLLYNSKIGNYRKLFLLFQSFCILSYNLAQLAFSKMNQNGFRYPKQRYYLRNFKVCFNVYHKSDILVIFYQTKYSEFKNLSICI